MSGNLRREGPVLKIIRREIIDIYSGYTSKNLQIVYLLVYLGIFSFLITVSYLLYPVNYSMFSNFISDLGMPDRNPRGFGWFTAAMIWDGIMFLPILRYIYRRLKIAPGSRYGKLLRFFNIAAKSSALLGCAGMVLVGVIPQNFSANTPHLIAMSMAFGGFYFSMGSNLMILTFRKLAGYSWPYSYRFIGAYLPPFLSGIIYNLTPLLETAIGVYLPSGMFSYYFWEWMCMLSSIAWILWIVLYIPDFGKKNRNFRETSAGVLS